MTTLRDAIQSALNYGKAPITENTTSIYASTPIMEDDETSHHYTEAAKSSEARARAKTMHKLAKGMNDHEEAAKYHHESETHKANAMHHLKKVGHSDEHAEHIVHMWSRTGFKHLDND